MTGEDWATAASLATAAGTLVLAIATFSSVRSANRSARAAERSLLAGLRPLLALSRPDSPAEKVGFADQHWVKLEGGGAVAECTDEAIYLVLGLRNVGSGLAVLDRWYVTPERVLGAGATHADPAAFRRLTRDLYIPPGDSGFWQGAIRERDDPLWEPVRAAIDERRPLTVDLLYADHEGGQRTVSRFSVLPRPDAGWFAAVTRHWNLDRSDPR